MSRMDELAIREKFFYSLARIHVDYLNIKYTKYFSRLAEDDLVKLKSKLAKKYPQLGLDKLFNGTVKSYKDIKIHEPFVMLLAQLIIEHETELDEYAIYIMIKILLSKK
jgi:hypothetical protein